MPRKRRDIHNALVAKGFRTTENDHTWYIFHTAEGRQTRVRTKLSHGSPNRDVPDHLLSQMARQLRLPLYDFRNLIDCPLDRTAYEAILAANDALPES